MHESVHFSTRLFCHILPQDILKYTEKAGLDTTDLKKALRVMCIVPKAANDMMQVGRLQGFDVSYKFIHFFRSLKFIISNSFPAVIICSVRFYIECN